MQPPNLSLLAPRDLIPALAWLGRHDWLRLTAHADHHIKIDRQMPPRPAHLPEDQYRRLIRLMDLALARGNDLISIYSTSKFFATGPKIFRPTVAQCEAMCQIEVNIPTSSYNQPFPAVLFQYPEEFCRDLTARLGCKRVPRLSLCCRDEKSGFIQVSSIFDESDSVYAIIPCREDRTVEDVLMFHSRPEDVGDPEFALGEALQRIALNFCLMMMEYPTKLAELNPAESAHHRQMRRAKNLQKRLKGEILAACDMNVISFDQSVTFFKPHDLTPADAKESSVGSMSPHWRRGHWRMQRCGHKLAESRRILIKPVLVRSDKFAGDFSNTTVTYS